MCGHGGAIVAYSQLRRQRTRARLDAEVRSGRIERLRVGVYAVGLACEEARTAAAHGGAPGCATAARHLGLWTLSDDEAVHVWMTGSGHRHAHDGCRCVEHWDAGVRDGFGVPSVPRILRQILACDGVEAFLVTLESARNKGMLTRSDLEWLMQHTNDAAREAIAFSRADAESGLETIVRWRLRRHGLRIRTQVVMPSGGRVDLLIGDRLIVEVDGRMNHEGAAMRHKDLVRDASDAAWGYVTLRFDYAMVIHDWEIVEAAILRSVAAGHHRGGSTMAGILDGTPG